MYFLKEIRLLGSLRSQRCNLMFLNFRAKNSKYSLQMSSEEIMAIHDEFSTKFAHKLNAFYQLRSLFAPLIEGLILLDRLTFLRQQVRKYVRLSAVRLEAKKMH